MNEHPVRRDGPGERYGVDCSCGWQGPVVDAVISLEFGSWAEHFVAAHGSGKPTGPIRVPCEGSGHRVRNPFRSVGFCALCGVVVTCTHEGIAFDHDRIDVAAMLARGDFAS